ncbi:pyruvate dehydrogenase complex dihydrolipoamide acetyltransferase [Wolbachia endosymbiont of Diaphorina citri]|jgi:pyruvate dehydrogenase complex dihydrolipoamide acetyltransferase, long form|uniref:pyruvate dehydrogenase complex dihydrolipoamide acetyltransferase n=1 Tax=Wolbachia endosymbiont of Diaphorina citri TaxID=116598 RepID=UPI0003157F6F|nr:pyruvate dehydrogenase complex dihydrolipoamide acetyltransferase [Wolbachia endosymbiont of Diaphorina citri]QJT94530.1 pyruvate dehydrogenase complex dihydrolipoamide acetyltransferase [Wolbachia endosymbiont of Diaphorina citri]QJT95770.1 pyruvate dehydrogenase complex dihydrolipoamide acetyltransferase [Wolbachia endosymbiont of Diaphorina citri]QJT97132.1 pyruvate dehydrogenase complex dihydrolipoamide acetyltransferase [Wolbachia endosymbiont of Diaphorina citri]QLK11428.1 pyruvate deh
MPIEILMPALSPTMSKTGGKIVKWCKKEQDKVEIGDVIAEIETDKAIMEFESVDEGVLAKILVSEGTSGVPVNQLIALMLEEGEDKSTLDLASAINTKVEKEVEADFSVSSNPSISSSSSMSSQCVTLGSKKEDRAIENRIKVSPLAKKIAQNEGIDIKRLKGTGPYGRVIKADVLEFLDQTKSYERFEENITVEVSNMRQVIAQRLVESKQNIPHFYLTVDCHVDKLISLKNEVNSANENNKVTINDLIIKAVAFSMKKFPDINSSWVDTKIVRYSNIDISIAVALEDGLITPIVKNADEKSVLSISKEVKDLVSRARSGKLKPEEFQGGGFTISNLGMFGIKTFSAIINPPQSCIMAVGESKKQPVVIGEKIEIAEIMTVTLSVDHRAVDGALGAKFLNAFKYYIENPTVMLLEPLLL